MDVQWNKQYQVTEMQHNRVNFFGPAMVFWIKLTIAEK